MVGRRSGCGCFGEEDCALNYGGGCRWTGGHNSPLVLSLFPGIGLLANPAKPTEALKRLMGFKQGVIIELPFPPASLSGHNTGHWRSKSGIVAKHREWAKNATLASHPDVHSEGDIRVSVTFYPPNKRGDRVNFPNRMKPYWDGIADALKVNDSRFLPAYYFAEPVKNARVVVSIG